MQTLIKMLIGSNIVQMNVNINKKIIFFRHFLLIIFCCCASQLVNAQVSQKERQALIDLYISTDGDNWTNTKDGNKAWLINDPSSLVGDWFGITVIDNKVTELKLDRNSLTGTIPNSITNLPHLTKLSLSWNTISGTIPNNLGDLANLEVLSLSRNRLTGSIPESLTNLSELKSLSLFLNKLSGTIPSNIGNLQNLKLIHFGFNNLEGTIPIGVFSLTKLTFLYLSGNKFYGELPNDISNLKNLVTLALSNNNFSGNLSVQLGNIPNLKNLSFERNSFVFRNFENEHISYTTNLNNYKYFPQANVDKIDTLTVTTGKNITLTSKALNSPNNTYQWYKNGIPITGAINKDFVIENAKETDEGTYHFTATNNIVTDLTLTRHPIVLSVNEDVCGVSNEEKQVLINLYNSTDGANWTNNTNWLTNTPVCDWFGVGVRNGRITGITLRNNNLSGTIPTSIGQLSELQYLFLNSNKLIGEIPSELGSLSKLLDFMLYSNQLTGSIPPELGNLSSLRELNLLRNRLSGAIPEELGNLPGSLFRINLAENYNLGGKIPSSIKNLSGLTTLRLNTNSFIFSDLEAEHDDLKDKLNIFEYSRQALVDKIDTLSIIEGSTFTLTSKVLSSPNNTYQWYKDRVAIEGATNKDYIIENAKKTDEGVYHFTANNSIVTGLTITRNPILLSVIPDTCGVSESEKQALLAFYNATHGESWTNTLGNNQPWNESTPVCSWYGVAVSNGKVTGLDLDENELNGVIPPSISQLLHLTSLSLDSNNLTGSIPASLGALSELTHLSIHHNSLNSILPPSLGSLSNLEVMDLSHNSTIQGPIPIAFCNLAELKILNLSNNQLSGNIPKELGILTQLQQLDLRHNVLSGEIPIQLGNLRVLEFLGLSKNKLSGKIPLSVGQGSLLETFVFEENGFIFSDFENKHTQYLQYINSAYQYAPQSKTDKQEIKTVSVGNNITLTTILASPNNSYQWYKNGIVIPGAENREFMIENASVSDTGAYHFTATNSIIEGLILERHPIQLRVEQSCNVPNTERQALIDLYTATDGANWVNTLANNQPWNINDDSSAVCDWYGVVVEDNNIVELNLGGNQLTGVLSNIFAAIPFLRKIDFSSNHLSGELPTSLSNLSGLNTFAIEQNGFIFENFETIFNNFSSVNFSYQPQANVDLALTESINFGSTLTLTSNQLNSENNRYQWFKNGLPIEGATNKELKIENATDENSGMYFFNATNTIVTGLTLIRNPIKVTVRPIGDSCGVSQAEKQALWNLYQATDGANWTNTLAGDKPWDLNTPVCNWYGITVVDSKILRIDLPNNNLSGEFFPHILGITSLNYLNVPNNDIQGRLPNTIDQLSNLYTLNLGGNSMIGQIPNEISNLSKLRELHLNLNNFTGVIPRDLEGLISLQKLFLNNNELVGGIPASIGYLIALQHLDLSYNKLEESIPLELENLSNLAILNISSNNFKNILPGGISKITSLRDFRLMINSFVFADIEPHYVDFKTQLGAKFYYVPQANVDQEETKTIVSGTSVTLTSNELTSPNNTYQWFKNGLAIPEATNKDYIIENASDTDAAIYHFTATNRIISDLTLTRNPITLEVLDAGACEVSKEDRQALVDFYLTTNGNAWINTINNNSPWLINDSTSRVCNWYGVTVSSDLKIEKIELSNNNLRGEIPVSLAELNYLVKIDLSQNELVGEIPLALKNLTSLKELRLQENTLVDAIPEAIGNLVNLEILDLGKNRFSSSIPANIGNLQKLIELDLSANKLEDTIPDGLWTIAPLQTIKLQRNKLEGTVSSEIGNLSKLAVFWLSANNFAGNIPPTLENIPGLYSVHLDSNSFHGDLPLLIPNYNLPNTDVQIQNNGFVFSDFESEHPGYRDNLSNYIYSPQAKVDRREIITVQLNGIATLFTEALTSPNNTYKWFKNNVFFKETTSRQFKIDNITEADLGDYYFTSTNSTIEGLVLTRNTITLQLGTDPPITNVQSFCAATDTIVFIANLTSPFNDPSKWFENKTGGDELPFDFEIYETSILWAENTAQDPRVAVKVIIDKGISGDELDDLDYQAFLISLNPTIADLEPKGNGISWYETPIGGMPLSSTTPLANKKTYYAQQGNGTCRFAVGVFVGVFEPDGDGWLSFCKSDEPTIADLQQNFVVLPNHELVWYKNETGSETYNLNEALINNGVYYVVQKDQLNNESKRRRITVSVFDLPPPRIIDQVQEFYTNEPVSVSNLVAFGQNIKWYDAPFGGTVYSPSEQLVDGATYYAAQTDLNCKPGERGCCVSTERQQVTVKLINKPPPSLVGCERFRPQPGAHYVISAWVREDGLLAINPVTRDFNEVSDLFTELLNHLLHDKILASLPEDRHIPNPYIPEKREFDALIPFIKDAVDKNLTIYNFKYVKKQQNGVGPKHTVGFEFSLVPNGTYKFKYLTPRVVKRKPLNRRDTLNYHYPLLHNPTLNLKFTGTAICGQNFCTKSSFSIVGAPYTFNKQHIIDSYSGTSGILPSIESYTYIPDPNYQVMDYANSLLRLTYRRSDGTEISLDSKKIEFRPQGPIVDGWQHITSDFTIPSEATNMIIALESNISDQASALINVYFDDIRMHPFDGNMKTFVYDPFTQRLQAELDENNYATFYEYDQEGGLIRVKKETDRGIFTIQETRSGNSKLSHKEQ